jgi:hypothetical protein
MIAVLNWITLLLTIITSTGLLLSRDWRWSLGFLAAQYFCVFWMVQTHWPISMAAAKLVTGWMACAVLGITQLTVKGREETSLKWPQGRLFQIFTAGMVVAVTYALSLRVVTWLGLSLPIAWGGILLIGLGLLQLGITAESFQVVLGLLTVMAGFEILYAAVESSILVAALLVIVNLGLAMAGAYFLNISQPEEIV